MGYSAQHDCGDVQHSSPAAQQSLCFVPILAEAQHARGGLQHSSPAAQQSVFVFVTEALALLKQHACGGLQQSAFTVQQFTFELD